MTVVDHRSLCSNMSLSPADVIFQRETAFAGAEKTKVQEIMVLDATPTPDEADMNS